MTPMFTGRVGQTYVIVPNFMAIRRTIAELWRFNNFFNIVAVRHSGFLKCDYLKEKL